MHMFKEPGGRFCQIFHQWRRRESNPRPRSSVEVLFTCVAGVAAPAQMTTGVITSPPGGSRLSRPGATDLAQLSRTSPGGFMPAGLLGLLSRPTAHAAMPTSAIALSFAVGTARLIKADRALPARRLFLPYTSKPIAPVYDGSARGPADPARGFIPLPPEA